MALASNLLAVVDETGISAPTYADILAGLQEQYRAIYGNDIYIEADSQDGQFLGVLALAIKDANDTAVAVYNAFSPSTAVGAGLSSVVKVNGLNREIFSNSTAIVTLVGQVGITIQDGIISDNLNLGSRWVISGLITIPLSGQIDATAVSIDPGAITAGPNSLTHILTPVPGWQTVTNAAAAIPGQPVELDASLRRRQSKSTSLPALTPTEALYAALANIPGVQRVAVWDNDTNLTVQGIPAHNIAVVVAGGGSLTIAETIALKKTPGVPTFGSSSQVVFDNRGMPKTINFFPLVTVKLNVLVFLKALTGYVDTTGVLIQSAVAYYVNSLDIGGTSYLGRLWAPTDLKGDEATAGTSITQAELDLQSRTYHVTEIAQNRPDTIVTGGPYLAGAVVVNVTNVEEVLSVGSLVYFVLDDLSYFRAIISGVLGTAVTISPGVPPGRQINNASLVYVADDINAQIYEAFSADAATNITIVAT